MVQAVSADLDFWTELAVREIKDTYGDTVIIKPKSLRKFGRTSNADNDVPTTVMTLPGATQRFETYSTTNDIDRISSSDDGDEQVVRVEGHTIDSLGNLTFKAFDVTLTGQTPAVLGISLARMSRIANSGSSDFAGTIYGFASDGVTVTNGVPQTNTAVKCMVAAGKNQSQKAATSFSSVDYGIFTGIYASVARGNSAVNADIELEVRNQGGVFREQYGITLRSDGASSLPEPLRPFLIVPPNSDVRLIATASVNDTTINGGFNALFGLISR